MKKKLLIFFIFHFSFFIATGTVAFAETAKISDFISADSYNTMYPYMDNKMRVAMNPGTTPATTQSGISAVVKTGEIDTNTRRVVARSGSNARAAAPATAPSYTTARSGITTAASNMQGLSNVVPTRRVVARGARDNTVAERTAPNIIPKSDVPAIASSRCLADYTACMNGYCERKNAAYNRCYCSAKLSQIDAQYQTSIDTLIKKILTMRDGANPYTADEMNQYWEDMVVKYTGENSWTNLDNDLNINWADMESRVRGQNAFITGHDYCVQHLNGCQYMADNMRDAYRSDIARDCAAYETSLKKVQSAATTWIENYSE